MEPLINISRSIPKEKQSQTNSGQIATRALNVPEGLGTVRISEGAAKPVYDVSRFQQPFTASAAGVFLALGATQTLQWTADLPISQLRKYDPNFTEVSTIFGPGFEIFPRNIIWYFQYFQYSASGTLTAAMNMDFPNDNTAFNAGIGTTGAGGQLNSLASASLIQLVNKNGGWKHGGMRFRATGTGGAGNLTISCVAVGYPIGIPAGS